MCLNDHARWDNSIFYNSYNPWLDEIPLAFSSSFLHFISINDLKINNSEEEDKSSEIWNDTRKF